MFERFLNALSKYTHDVVLTSIWRLYHVADVLWTLKRRVSTGSAFILNKSDSKAEKTRKQLLQTIKTANSFLF